MKEDWTRLFEEKAIPPIQENWEENLWKKLDSQGRKKRVPVQVKVAVLFWILLVSGNVYMLLAVNGNSKRHTDLKAQTYQVIADQLLIRTIQ